MTRNNLLIGTFLGLFSMLPIMGSENSRPSTTQKLNKIAVKGCIGGCGGLLLYGLAKTHNSGTNLSPEDLSPMALSCGIGFCGGVVAGLIDSFQERHRIYNDKTPLLINQQSLDMYRLYHQKNPSLHISFSVDTEKE